MEAASSRWFTGSFVDRAYLQNWAIQNASNISSRTASFLASSAALEMKTNDVPPLPPTVPPKPKRRTMTRKTKPMLSEEDNDATTDEEKKPEKQKPKPRKRKQVVGNKSETDSEEETKIDTMRKPPQHIDGPLAEEKEWFFSGISTRQITPIAQVPSTTKYDIKFDNKRIVYFKSMYYLKRMFDGSAVGNICMVRRVMIDFFFVLLLFIFFFFRLKSAPKIQCRLF